MADPFAYLEPCEPDTMTPLCTAVAWWPPDPEIGNPCFPVPIDTWETDEPGSDGWLWPPHTPGTHHPYDVEVESAR